MLKFKISTFVLSMTVMIALLTGCVSSGFPAVSNDQPEVSDDNFYPEDTNTSHNFGPGY